MKYYVFRTDIESAQKVEKVGSIFQKNPVIKEWNVDTHDVDNVLRIRQSMRLKENDIINLIQSNGFFCEALPD